MSEQSMAAEMGSPRNRAIAYLELRQSGRFQGGKEKNVKTPLVPEKVRDTGPIVDTVAAYETLVDRMGDKGFEGSQKILADMRPVAYDAAQVVQMGARIADLALTVGIWFPGIIRGGVLLKGAATWGMLRYRPLEWATAKIAQIGSAAAGSERVAPIVNNIIGGGERVPSPVVKPATA